MSTRRSRPTSRPGSLARGAWRSTGSSPPVQSAPTPAAPPVPVRRAASRRQSLGTQWLPTRERTAMTDDRGNGSAAWIALQHSTGGGPSRLRGPDRCPRGREKEHTREGDAIAAARRNLPMVEVDAGLEILGPSGPLTLLDAFEGRRQLIAYYFMWIPGCPAPEQCEGCTSPKQITQLAYLHSPTSPTRSLQGRNTASAATDAQATYEESLRYRDFMGWDLPWYLARPSSRPCWGLDSSVCSTRLLPLPRRPRLRDVLDPAPWRRGAGQQLRAHGPHRVRPPGGLGDVTSWWPRRCTNTRSASGSPTWSPVAQWPGGRPIAQWQRLDSGHSDDLGSSTTGREPPAPCH